MKSAALAITLLLPGLAFAAGFDGAYQGGATLSGGDYIANGRCPPGKPFGLQVRDGAFVWRGGGEETTIKVGADGGFAGQNGARFLSGRIEASAMTAEMKAQHCFYTWSLTR